jgi:Holliday junction resolvase RusA-like endonuclease
LLDALEHAGVYENDSQLDELHIIRQELRPSGACKVVITQLHPS